MRHSHEELVLDYITNRIGASNRIKDGNVLAIESEGKRFRIVCDRLSSLQLDLADHIGINTVEDIMKHKWTILWSTGKKLNYPKSPN